MIQTLHSFATFIICMIIYMLYTFDPTHTLVTFPRLAKSGTLQIIMDLENIEAIRGWLAPKNVTEVRSFMGLAGYYQSFIEGFSRIAHLINCLQKKGVKF
jgi:hypothetical protein